MAGSYAFPSWEKRRPPSDLLAAQEAMRMYTTEVFKLSGAGPGLPRFARQRAHDAIRIIAAVQSHTLMKPSSVRPPPSELALWPSTAYELMSHLSNIRLSLALRVREPALQPFSDAVAAARLELNRLLQGPLPNASPDPTHVNWPRLRLSLTSYRKLGMRWMLLPNCVTHRVSCSFATR